MELTEKKTLDMLLASGPTLVRRAIRHPKARPDARPDYQAPSSKSVSRRCRCGVCETCVENARWERIFQEKFADPTYYDTPPRRGSTLGW